MFTIPTLAQEKKEKKVKVDSIPMIGYVYDRLTSHDIIGTTVQILRPDSSVISSALGGRTTIYYINGTYKVDSTSKYEIYLPRIQGDYIIKVSKTDYEDTYVPYSAEIGSRIHELTAPKIYMSRPIVKDLQEVTVKASKIKVYHKGDTIVYDPSAFILPEGSMLDALVQQMPGVEIKGNKIYVNGRFVESLLLNGKDFFKGDQSVAMHNIGAYSVKNVAVYEKNEESSELLGNRDDIEKEYVMDVRLKRDYMTGTAVNADLGYGIRGRYKARLFGLRYTNNSRLSLYGNTNNMNVSNQLDENGDKPSGSYDPGIVTRGNAGIDYSADNSLHTWSVNGNADIHYKDNRTESIINSIQNFQGADNYMFNESSGRLNKLAVSTYHDFRLKHENWNMYIVPSFSYNKVNSNNENTSATFNNEFDGISSEIVKNLYTEKYANLTTAIINRNLENIKKRSHGYESELKVGSKIRIPKSPDALEFKGNVQYRRESELGNTLQDICFGNLDGMGLAPVNSMLQQRERSIHPVYTLRLLGLARYYFTLPLGSLNASYEYIHTQSRKNSGLMVMESLAQGTMAEFLPGQVWIPDFSNSYTSKFYKNQHHFKLIWALKKKYGSGVLEMGVEPNIYLERHDLFYTQGNATVTPAKSFVRFKVANTRLVWAKRPLRLQLAYNFDQEAPNLLEMVDIPNTTDPLNIRVGNPDLKKSSQHSFNAMLYHSPRAGTAYNIYIRGIVTDNDICNGFRYNSDTGIREVSAYNVNGNNVFGIYSWISHSLGKSQDWSLDNSISCELRNYSNMIGYDSDPVKQRVRTWTFSEYPEISFEKEIISFTLGGRYTGSHYKTDEINPLVNITGDYGANFRVNLKLPFNFNINSEIEFKKYYGYIDENMNRKEWNWNAKIGYSILKGALTFTLSANDILNQQKFFYQTVSASERTQRDDLTLGRMVLFSVGYKFNFKPKRGNK